MRTTLHIDDDVYQVARSLAATEGSSIGKVLSRLARRGLNQRRATRSHKGFPVFDVPAEAKPLTPEMVKEALDET
jgi:predicted transcriptional regulator